MNNIQNKTLVFLLYLALATITFAVFFQVRNFDLVNYDDNKYVTENRHILTGLTRENVIWAFTSGYAANWHPLTWLSHMLDCQLFKTNPAGHHLINLLLHIINALLLLAVLYKMTGSVGKSAFVAALFALHPLTVESVAWVSERKNVLSTMFWFLTLIAYVRYTKLRNLKWYFLALSFFTLGLMAKPMLVTLPFVLLLLDYWPLERLERKNLYYLILEKLPFFAFSTVSCIITFFVQRSGGAVALILKLPPNMRIANCFVSYIEYMRKTIWPSKLTVFYPYPLNTIPAWHIILAVLLLLAISVFAIFFASRHRYLFAGWFWYLGTLVPVIGIVQVGEQAWADRYSYIPLIGLFIIAAWAFPFLLKKVFVPQTMIAFLALIILSVFSVCTLLQLRYWRNSATLFEHALAINKNNYVAHYCLGDWWLQQGKNDKAVAHFNEALRINPNYLLAHIGLGITFAKQGKLDQAIERFRYGIKYDPEFAEAYYNLGVALAAQGKYNNALQQYHKAAELNPDYVTVYNNMGAIFFLQGKLDEAIDCYQKALKLEPDYADAHNNLGAALSAQGKLDEAISQFRKSLQLKPDAANTQCNLGYALARQGKSDEGIAHISEAVRLNPNLPEAHYYLALILAQKGRIAEAIKNAEQALELAQSAENTHLADQIRKSLDSYKSLQK